MLAPASLPSAIFVGAVANGHPRQGNVFCSVLLEHPVLELGWVQFHQRFEGNDRVQPGIAEVLMTHGVEVEVPQMKGPFGAVELDRARQVVPPVDLLTVVQRQQDETRFLRDPRPVVNVHETQ